MTIRIIQGDCRDELRKVPSDSVHCVVTSPPYYGLRDYGTATWEGGDAGCDHAAKQPKRGKAAYTDGRGKAYASNLQAWGDRDVSTVYRDTCGKCGARRIDAQLGLEATPDAYIATMVRVFREVKRVLRPDGTCFVNIGDSYAGSQRAAAYDKGGKAPASSRGDGCLCGSLCDGCRKAYRIGRFHSDGQRVPTPVASIASSIPERMAVTPGHAPRSGSTREGGHNSDATLDPVLAFERAYGLPPDAPASTTTECERQLLAECSPTSIQGAGCLSCGRSLADCAPVSARMAACTCGTEDGAWVGHTIGTVSSGLAYPGYTTASPKPKDLLMMPARLAVALQADGWWLRSDIIWAKPNPMPESVKGSTVTRHMITLQEYERLSCLWSAGQRSNEDGTSDLLGVPSREVSGRQTTVSADTHRSGMEGDRAGCQGALLLLPGEDEADAGSCDTAVEGRPAHQDERRPSLSAVQLEEERSADPAGLVPCPGCDRCNNGYIAHLYAGRPTSAHEHVFLLTKRARYFYDADAVREEPTGRTDPIRSFGHVPERNDNGHTFALDAMKGRNLRNVWTIATHAYPNAHFATFAPELAERCIRAGTSERGCCAQCGAPWVRTTKATGGILGKSWHDHSADAAKGNAGVWVGQPAVEPYQRTTIAWSPSCKCQANYDCSGLGCGHQPCICIGVKPCTVLDCFSGAGTALLVADRLQRHAIGIDLNPAYLDMSTARIREDLPLFVDIATTEALQQVDEQREHQLEMFQAVE